MAVEGTEGEGANELSLEEARKRFTEQRNIFDEILVAGFAVDTALTGAKPQSPAAYQGAVIFTKALAHSIALDKVAPRIGLPKQMFDIPSCAVLVRAIAESYVAFRYYSVEAVSKEDAAFRLALMNLHHRAKQFKIMKRFGIADSRLTDAQSLLDAAQAALEKDRLFQSQSESVRREQLKGRESMHRTLEQIAEAAGINPNLWGSLYAFLSQFAHTSPMAVTHVANFRADTSMANSDLAMMLQLAAGLLGKFIVDLESVFIGCTDSLTPSQRQWIAIEVNVIENLTSETSNAGISK